MTSSAVDVPVVPESSDAVASQSQLADRTLSGPLFIGAAGLAGIVGALLVAELSALFSMPEEFQAIPLNASAEYMARYHRAFQSMFASSYTCYFATMGSVIGLAVGVCGALGRRRPSALASLAGGGLTGAVGGFVLGMIAVVFLRNNINRTIDILGVPVEPMVQSTALQCGVWVLIGMGIGCGWTLSVWGKQKLASGIEGGVLGGLLAGFVYSALAAIAFSNSNAFLFVPEWLVERVVWGGVCGLGLGCGLYYSVATRSRPKPAA